MEQLVNFIINALENQAVNELIIFIISLFPILELRGGLLAASILGVSSSISMPICIIGNLLPIPFILILIKPIFKWLRSTKVFRPMVEKLEAKAIGKSDQIAKYEFLGLILFVGIPLPGTGAWTGALISSLLDMDWKKSFLAIIIGVLIASLIMYIISYGFVANII